MKLNKKIVVFILSIFILFSVNISKCDDIREIVECSTYNGYYLVRANYPSASGWYQAVSQSFKSEITANLSSIDFLMFKSGTPDFELVCELRGVSSDSDFINGIAYPNETLYDTSLDYDESDIPTYFKSIRFYFEGNYIITNQSKYCVLLYTVNGTVDGDGFRVVYGANNIIGNRGYYIGSWSLNTIDLFVRVNGIIESESISGEYTQDNLEEYFVLGGLFSGVVLFLLALTIYEKKKKR